MKISELEDTDKIVTKDYLDAKLQQLRADLLHELSSNQRWNIGLICGLYATNFALLLGIIGTLYAVLSKS